MMMMTLTVCCAKDKYNTKFIYNSVHLLLSLSRVGCPFQINFLDLFNTHPEGNSNRIAINKLLWLNLRLEDGANTANVYLSIRGALLVNTYYHFRVTHD